MTEIRQLAIPGVFAITPKRHGDARGWFSETWNRRTLAQAGIVVDFVQDNHSYSAAAGTLRGMHYQLPPMAQAKLVRVPKGAVLDVVVDIRKGSPTFARWVSLRLDAATGTQLFVPAGFAHGFVTLEPETEVIYKVDQYYDRDSDRTIRHDDPAIGIDWPAELAPFELSDKDRNAPSLAAADKVFEYQ